MRVTIMGLGLFGGGLGAARYFAEAGHEVTVTDLATAETLQESLSELSDLPQIRYVLGRHEAADILDCDLLVASPAVPFQHDLLRQRRQEGGAISTEIELVLKQAKQRILAITGSNGKTTTANMVTDLLQASGLQARLSGNAGGSVLPELATLPDDLILVLELSSFQLERMQLSQRPVVGAILTNLSANHLDRHGNMAAYVAAKKNLLKLMASGAPLVVNGDDEGSREFATSASEQGLKVVAINDQSLADYPAPARLIGRFNHHNLALASALCAQVFGRQKEAEQNVARDFSGLPHRLQVLGRLGPLLVVNDSKSTTPFATAAAVAALEGPVHLIAGGYDKGLPADEILATFDHCESVVLTGATAARLAADYASRTTSVKRPIFRVDSLQEALAQAVENALAPGYLLFSPGHPSYDAYVNFEARGRALAAVLREFPQFSPL